MKYHAIPCNTMQCHCKLECTTLDNLLHRFGSQFTRVQQSAILQEGVIKLDTKETLIISKVIKLDTKEKINCIKSNHFKVIKMDTKETLIISKVIKMDTKETLIISKVIKLYTQKRSIVSKVIISK